MGGHRCAALRVPIRAALALAALAWPASPDARAQPAPSLVIPPAQNAPARHVTTEDLVRIRDIDSLSVSTDGTLFAILVRQAEPEANRYRTGWFVGSVAGSALTYVGDGGEMRLLTRPNGAQTGDVGGSVARWSPDARLIAYTARRGGEVQLWTSRSDGGGQRQLTRNASDVRDFGWAEDGRRLLFTVGTTRAARDARIASNDREGHLLQSFSSLYRAVNPGDPAQPLETSLTIWTVEASGRGERQASEGEQRMFAALQERQFGERGNGVEADLRRASAALGPPSVADSGAIAWLERDDPQQTGPLPFARLRATLDEADAPVICTDARCGGQFIRKLWWHPDGMEVIFWSLDGPTDMRQSLYAWAPAANRVRTILSTTEHVLTSCERAGERLVCLRESPLEPRHVAAIDIVTGAIARIGDVNPEFASLQLGRAERIEWDTVPDVANMGYSPRAAGIVLYPPGYDPSHAYPLFVAPYAAGGFLRGDVGDEHPLLTYAASGIVVLNTAFPHAVRALVEGDANIINRRAYDPAFGYPHLTMLADTTFAGMDALAARMRIDPARIGIGGVSHGAFVPLFMVQKRDRFAALSVAQGSWHDSEYHYGRLPFPYGAQPESMFPRDPEFWAPIDLSRHLGEIEAPILFHVASRELAPVVELVRGMSDARLPFEAFSFNDETHLKWQPAHRLAIYNRNLDWFRFWLQDVEDLDPAKEAQYERWRQLRALQCRNPRSLRNYCGAVSRPAPIAR